MTAKLPTKFSIVVESFKKKCNDSTAHGLPKVFGSDLFGLRVLWTILFLGGTVGAIAGKKLLIF